MENIAAEFIATAKDLLVWAKSLATSDFGITAGVIVSGIILGEGIHQIGKSRWFQNIRTHFSEHKQEANLPEKQKEKKQAPTAGCKL